MKLIKYFQIVTLIFLVFSCSSDDGNMDNNINNRTSSCNNVLGYTGLYWDFANGLPTGLSQVPIIQNPGQQFIDSLQPLLGFTLPQGFTAFELNDPQSQTIGVNVFRNDNEVLFCWIPSSSVIGQQIPSQDFIANEINNMFSFYDFNGTPEVLCSGFKQQIFATIPMEFNARLLRFNGRIAQVWVITTYAASSTYITVSVVTGPEAEYDTQVANTFLPLNFQLYVNESGGIIDEDITTKFIGSVIHSQGPTPGEDALGWQKRFTELQKKALSTRLGIPLLFAIEAVHGQNTYEGATIFPHNIGLGATSNFKLVEEVAAITAIETQATGFNWTFFPCIAIPYNEKWGRVYEAFSESTELTSKLTKASVDGDLEIFQNGVKAGIVNGDITPKRIDDAVRRILRQKFRLGLFENPFPSPKLIKKIGSQVHRDKAKQAVRESLVLLKNKNGILPLGKDTKKLLLSANMLITQDFNLVAGQSGGKAQAKIIRVQQHY